MRPRSGDNDEWIEDRMFGVQRDEAGSRRRLPVGEPPEVALAGWMLEMLRKTGGLSQRQAIWGIRELFGPEYLARSPQGGWTIPRPVLQRFRQLDPTGVVWSGRLRAWRPRRPDDPPERRNVP